jgi:formiminoglutamase
MKKRNNDVLSSISKKRCLDPSPYPCSLAGTMNNRYPFLISIPHGGVTIPEVLMERSALTSSDILYYSDPDTRSLFDFREWVVAVLDTEISRIFVDLNRPPYALPPRHNDGVVKYSTAEGKPVYRNGSIPDITLLHQVLMRHYFPYHAQLDQILETREISLALDCHSMLPVGPPGSKDEGRVRPMICLGNNGDREGKAKKDRLATCTAEWITGLADAFREEFLLDKQVTINHPFSGGFITNAHYWHTGVPFVQLEVNRVLYESGDAFGREESTVDRIRMLKQKIWNALHRFWYDIL